VTTKRYTVREGADQKLGCSRCHAKLRSGEAAVALISDGFVEHQHEGACPTYVKPLPSGDWHIQGSKETRHA
jgi:hypothetical protein